MKTKSSNLLGAAVRDYFTDHLPRIRGMSPHTTHSYRDSGFSPRAASGPWRN
jgi:hypothetical protein